MPLTQKQLRFVAEYAIDLNATQAAIRAGYSRRSAQEQGSRLLSNLMVEEAIKVCTHAIASKLEVTAERVIAAIAAIAFGDVRGLFDGARLKRPDEWDDLAAATVASLEISSIGQDLERGEKVSKIKLADRLKALDMLARHLALYSDQVMVSVADGLADRVARAKARGIRLRPN